MKDFKVVKFRPKARIEKYVPSRGRDLIVFYPGTLYEGRIVHEKHRLVIVCEHARFPGTYKLDMKDVDIETIYYENHQK